MLRTLACLFAAAVLTSSSASAASAGIRTPATSVSDSTADRLVHGDGWDDIQPVTDFHDLVTRGTASSKTSCRFAYSTSRLLVKCTSAEVLAKSAPAMDAAKIQKGDYIALAVSTSRESKKPGTAVFFVNPKGLSANIGSYTGANSSWQSSVETTPVSWTATFDIPFANLYRPELSLRQLRVSIFRNDTTANTAFIWPSIPNVDPMSVYGQAEIPATPSL